jgi:predicted XRE-type DNA-binding protein
VNIGVLWKSLTTFRPLTNTDPLDECKPNATVAVIGMGFSANNMDDPDRLPGKSNEQIATIMAELWHYAQLRHVNLVVLTQREVAEALEIKHSEVSIDLILTEIGSEKHISSHDILGQAWKYCSRHYVTEAIVVAHRMHALRAKWNAEMWGFKVHPPHRYASAFAPESTQWHTHNALAFFFWEMLSRAKLVLLDRPD